jgi:hypothetical protein
MHGGTQRHEKPFSAVNGRCDVAHTLQTKNPARCGSKGGANQEFSAFASSALGEGYHTIRTEHSSDLKFNGSCRSPYPALGSSNLERPQPPPSWGRFLFDGSH